MILKTECLPQGLYTGEGGEYHHDMEQTYDPSNFAEYSTNGHGTGVVEEYETQNEFSPLSSVLGDGGVGISALAFDTHEELLWMGNQVSLLITGQSVVASLVVDSGGPWFLCR